MLELFVRRRGDLSMGKEVSRRDGNCFGRCDIPFWQMVTPGQRRFARFA